MDSFVMVPWYSTITNEDNNGEIVTEFILAINVGILFEVIEERPRDVYVSDHVTLNQCGTMYNQRKDHIKNYQP